MTDEQRQYYIDKVCSVCARRDECDKSKFTYSDAYERVSLRCLLYKFDEIFENK